VNCLATLGVLPVLGALALPPVLAQDVLILPAAATEGVAPDGRRGLLGEPDLKEVLGLFRRPDDADELFLTRLQALENEVRVLAATTRGVYLERDYFDLLGVGEATTLEALHDAFQNWAGNPEAVLRRRDRSSSAFAVMFFDARLRARMEILAGWEQDGAEIRAGLAVLRGNTDGFVRSSEAEARHIAARLDLAAALLRARFKDLEALREAPGSAAQVKQSDVQAYLAIPDLADPGERKRALGLAATAQAREVSRLRSLLFTTELRGSAARWIAWRGERDALAAELTARARLLLPGRLARLDIPADIARMTATKRRREAWRVAKSGLVEDPFGQELAYIAAVAARDVGGSTEAVQFYDRFLALRGQRTHDDRNRRGRTLTAEENEAIAFIQDYVSSGGGTSGG